MTQLKYAHRLATACLLLFACTSRSAGAEIPEPLDKLIRRTCLDCHEGESAEGGLDLASLAFTLEDRELRDCWILIHDRIRAGEMPPDPTTLSDPDRQTLLKTLNDAIAKADRVDVITNGRGPMRRLTREEYEQNLRDVLQLPLLDIRDMLPEDREQHGFNKSTVPATTSPTQSETAQSHRDLLNALQSGNPDRCEQCARRHANGLRQLFDSANQEAK